MIGWLQKQDKIINVMMIKSKSKLYLQQRRNGWQMEPNEKQRMTKMKEVKADHKRKHFLARQRTLCLICLTYAGRVWCPMNEWPPINLQDSLSCDRCYGPFTRFQKYKTFIPISFPSKNKKVSAFVCYIFDLVYITVFLHQAVGTFYFILKHGEINQQ